MLFKMKSVINLLSGVFKSSKVNASLN